jgi:hypothetical protein
MEDIFYWIGFLSTFLFIAKSLWQMISNRTKIQQYSWGWAVITGATQGIGLSYAKVLSSKGFNLIIISRNIKKLEET